ncbi:polyketide synthase [Aspergillus piperis CBS 112811]|uniref:Polyketide synthase n=1 Tax=Aspergillus piperis CBS 112811 TaxID=1448313 RepID=A0A8G1R077_9EURO|nr:polyketide synthase [Aspergillus piperis CBS 112811]RAH55380.1 polyketide synthase [Aspergillus piperis CBS 112811]
MPGTQDNPVMPIAIVGIGGRFPGDASNPDRLWELLLNAKSTLSETPKDRFSADVFYHPQPDRPGTSNSCGGHFMNQNIDEFDAPFFSITPSEARAMDPQQRMCLEVAYEAMENAGITMDRISGSRTSCYVGCFNHDYQLLQNLDLDNLPFYHATGTESSCLSNRVSWFFNLAGPSMTVDTACSSSLIALHLACQSIRLGESETALVGGVNIISFPEIYMKLSNLQMVSPDSKSQTFDEKANGYGRGEGTCFVVLKPLDKAIEDNDVIRAVIRNTGSNEDGNTPGLTLPSKNMQKALIEKVYEEAGLQMRDTGYFEAHGTGTVAGDSIETQALGETIGKSRPPGQPLWVGSLKANIGHLEGGSGLASLIKTVYVLEKGIIPPQIWLDKLNPRIRAEEWNLAVPTEVTPWPDQGPRRASVNSFGFAGANAHAILENAYSYLEANVGRGRHNSNVPAKLTENPDLCRDKHDANSLTLSRDTHGYVQPFPKLILWSAHEQGGLKRISESWKQFLDGKSGMLTQVERSKLLSNLAYTAVKRRTQFPWRSFTVCSDPGEIASGEVDIAPAVRSSQRPRLALVFTGQGAQHHAMGRRLMHYGVYANSLRTADQYLKSLGCPWSLVEELSRDAESSRINPPEFSQPLCIALQVAMVDLLKSWDIWPPEAVIGHSGGETAAAYAKGALTREAAWTVAYYRGQVCSIAPDVDPDHPLDGDMLAAAISEQEAQSYIQQVSSGKLVVACVNSPNSVTLSGDVPAIIDAAKLIKSDGHLAKKLGVNRAYHSAHMKVVEDMYRDLLKDVHGLPETPDLPKMFSCVTGASIDNCSLGGDYWVTNLINQVKFSQAMQALINHSDSRRSKRPKGYSYVNLMLEIGPHGALQGPVKQNLKAIQVDCTSVSALDRNKDAAQSLLEAIGVLFQHGYDSNIVAANTPDPSETTQLLVDLPPYPWNHSNRYWHEPAVASAYRFKKFPRKDLLGIRDNEGNNTHARWRHFLRPSENPWIEDHQVQGKVIYPAAGMLVMALEAARETADPDKAIKAYEIRDVSIKNAIIIPKGEEGAETMVHFHQKSSGWQEFSIYSRVGHNPWSQNCTGVLRVQYKINQNMGSFTNEEEETTMLYRSEYEEVEKRCSRSMSSEIFYAEQSELDLWFGETFQNVSNLRLNQGEMVFDVQTPDVRSKMPQNFTHDHLVHPCTLDPVIHASLAILNHGEGEKGPVIPTSIGRLVISAGISARPGTVLRAHSSATRHGLRDAELNIRAFSENREKPLIILDRIKVTRLGGGISSEGQDGLETAQKRIASEIHWEQDALHLTSQELRKLDLSNPAADGPDKMGPLESFIRLLGHKFSDLKILEIGAGDGNVTERLLDALEGHDGESVPLLEQYTATGSNDEAALLKKRMHSRAPYFHATPLALSQDWQEQGLSSQTYHCIIINAGDGRTAAGNAIEQSKGLLEANGVLIVLLAKDLSESRETWIQNLAERGLTNIEYVAPEDHNSDASSIPFLSSRMALDLDSSLPKDILLVSPCRPGELSRGLTEQLQSHGIRIHHATLCDTERIDLGDNFCLFLPELECPILFDLNAKDFLLLKRLLLESKGTLWVTAGATFECSNPKASLVTGLFRSVSHEHPELSLTTLDLDTEDSHSPIGASIIMGVLKRIANGDIDHEFTARGGQILIPRIRMNKRLNDFYSVLRDGPQPVLGPLKQPGRSLGLPLGAPGVFDSIHFRDDLSHQESLSPDTVEIEVKATGLNSHDLLSALDQVADPKFGHECSGIIRNVGEAVTKYRTGDRVMAWSSGAFANFTRVPEAMVQPMPFGMPFPVAASLPVSYCVAYHSLVECARLRRGESLLIHTGAGGVGQAAITIALNLGAKVYVTVGSEEKKLHLMDTYGIQDDHIFYSRDLSFSQGVSRLTKGSGVDVVLNSLSGEQLQHSRTCVASFGRFVDIRLNSTAEDTGLDMGPLPKNVASFSVNVHELYDKYLPRATTLFENAMRFYFENNCNPPSPLHANDEDQVLAIPPPIKATKLDADATYIIAGGFGGLGQHIAKWMVQRGARTLVFLSRSGSDHLDAPRVLEEIATEGANGVAYKCDICELEQVEATMKQMATDGLPAVRGIVQAAMALADSTFEQMTPDQWELSTKIKALGSWNLHLTAPAEIDFFVMLSSASGIAGLRGQGNYAAGNTFIDALAHHRHARGLPAVSIDVGPVTDIGYMAQRSDITELIRSLGFVGLNGDELLGILQTTMGSDENTRKSSNPQIILGLPTGGHLAAEGLDVPYTLSNARLARLSRIGAISQDDGESGPALSEQIKKAPSRASATEAVTDALRARLANQMMVEVEDVDASKPVSGYGVDSLTAVDIRVWCLKEAQADVSILDIVNYSSIMDLAQTIVENSRLASNDKWED